MGVGPAVAIPAAVKAAGLEIDDIDLFELNEVCSVVSIPVFLSSYVALADARFIHAPGICISICVLLQQVGTRPVESKCERRCDRYGAPSWRNR
jgi:hypothetical protein